MRIESALKQLAAGEFVCDVRFPEEFDVLSSPEGRHKANEWLGTIGYRLAQELAQAYSTIASADAFFTTNRLIAMNKTKAFVFLIIQLPSVIIIVVISKVQCLCCTMKFLFIKITYDSFSNQMIRRKIGILDLFCLLNTLDIL